MFTLAHEPRQSKAKGLVMFFTHLTSGHKGIACAMATEPIPVRATFPKPVSSVTVAMWGSTGTPALLEAFDSDGNVVDRKSLDSVPGRKAPGRSGAHLHHDGEREADRLRRVFRPAGRRIPCGGRSPLHAGRRRSIAQIATAGHFAFAATSKSPCV